MEKLNIPEELKKYIRKLTAKDELNPYDFNDQNIIEKINAAYQDCLKFYPRIKTFKLIAYNIIESSYHLPALEEDKTLEYIGKLLNDSELQNKLLNGNPESEFFSVLKDMLPYSIKLEALLNEHKPYEIMMLYKKITEVLNLETLGDYPDDEKLEEECKKRYDFPNNTAREYKFNMKMKAKVPYKRFDLSIVPGHGCYSVTCYLLTKYFHKKIYEYYKQYGFIYYPINDELSFYQFKSTIIIGYKFMDNVTLTVSDLGNVYNPESYQFWAIINGSLQAKYKVDDSNILSLVNMPGTILIAPDNHIAEALIKYLEIDSGYSKNSDQIRNLLIKLGIPLSFIDSNALSTTNNNMTYFYDPRNIDLIEVKDKSKFTVLSKLKSKNKQEREKYIKKLLAKYSGEKNMHRKNNQDEYEDTDDLSPREQRKNNPKAYL